MALKQLGEGVCPGSLEVLGSLEIGQVWELNVADRLEPSVLVELYHGTVPIAGLDADYWRCLSLESGTLFSATVRRWDPTYYANRAAAMGITNDVPLVGRRLL